MLKQLSVSSPSCENFACLDSAMLFWWHPIRVNLSWSNTDEKTEKKSLGRRSPWSEIVSLHLDSNLLFEELARTVYDTVVLVPGIHTIRVSKNEKWYQTRARGIRQMKNGIRQELAISDSYQTVTRQLPDNESRVSDKLIEIENGSSSFPDWRILDPPSWNWFPQTDVGQTAMSCRGSCKEIRKSIRI